MPNWSYPRWVIRFVFERFLKIVKPKITDYVTATLLIIRILIPKRSSFQKYYLNK